ncbi:MAG: ZIP family metal transporter [Flavobacteriia bacterium]|jgi:zinc transporter ZupT
MSVLLQISLLIAAVIVGGVIVDLLSSFNQKKIIKMLLAFSGGFLLAIAFLHFLPELYHDHSEKIGIYVLLGFLVQLFLEYFSGGIEHGHVHHHNKHKFPWALFISLSIHSIIEGIPLTLPQEMNHHHEHGSGISLLMGILFHQVPVAIALMTLLKQTEYTKLKSWVILLIFGIMTPMGLVLGYFTNGQLDFINMNYLLAIVVGMFLHISTTIIFETSENHKFNLMKLTSIMVGVFLALFIH